MNYKYSIIIPHYNDFENLKNLVNSIPQRDDIEIIIVDDYSGDVIDLDYFNKFKSLTFTYNSGIKSAGACRNIGLKLVKGKWLLFADADDFFVPGAFDIIDKVLDKSINKDLYFFKPISESLQTTVVSDRHVKYASLIDRYLDDGFEGIRYRFGPAWSKVFSVDFLRQNNCKFDEVIASNDVMFSLKVGFLAKTIQVQRDEIYCVTKGIHSLTLNKAKNIQVSRLLVIIREAEYIFENKIEVPKFSIIKLFFQYFSILNFHLINLLLRCFFKGHLSLFPNSYLSYIKNPKKIILRLKR